MIRLMIVEDQPDVKKGLRMRLSAEKDFSVIGDASDCDGLLTLLGSAHPQVVIIDAEMLRSDGFALANLVHTVAPHVFIILLSFLSDDRIRQRAIAAGASALIAKSMPVDTLLESIRQAAN